MSFILHFVGTRKGSTRIGTKIAIAKGATIFDAIASLHAHYDEVTIISHQAL